MGLLLPEAVRSRPSRPIARTVTCIKSLKPSIPFLSLSLSLSLSFSPPNLQTSTRGGAEESEDARGGVQGLLLLKASHHEVPGPHEPCKPW